MRFQYQGRADPVQPPAAAPETITCDKWLPCLSQPARRAFAVAVIAAGVFAPVEPTLFATPPGLGWGADYPDRVPRAAARQTGHFAGVFAPEQFPNVPSGWQGQPPDPARRPARP